MSSKKYLKGKNPGIKSEIKVIIDQKCIKVPIKKAKNEKKFYLLESREERAALLKAGLKDKDIESLYLQLNEIAIIGVNWSN